MSSYSNDSVAKFVIDIAKIRVLHTQNLATSKSTSEEHRSAMRKMISDICKERKMSKEIEALALQMVA